MTDSLQNKTLGLKEIILSILDWKKYYLSKLKLFVVVCLFGAAVGLLIAIYTPKKYTAEITFALEEKSGGMSGYAGLASQFGIDISKGEGGAFTGDNILELFKSQYIIENTLLSEAMFGNEKMLLINRYILANNFRNDWSKKPHLANINFSDKLHRSDFSRTHDSLLHAISTQIKLHTLNAIRLDKKLSIMSVSVQTNDELFSKIFAEKLAKNVHDFYISTKTQKNRVNVSLLQTRVDSVKTLLDGEMFGAAFNQDNNLNLVKAKGRLSAAQHQIKIQLLTTLYTELIKNLELSKLSLSREEPIIQIIDRPILPLPVQKISKTIGIVYGVIFAFILLTGYLTISRIYQIVMYNKD